jgi:hypothetical protein
VRQLAVIERIAHRSRQSDQQFTAL